AGCRDLREGLSVAALVPEDDDAGRADLVEQPRDSLTLRARPGWPHLEDPPAMERLEGRRAGRIRERGCHSVLDQPCRLVLVRRAARVECDRRALLLGESPARPDEC